MNGHGYKCCSCNYISHLSVSKILSLCRGWGVNWRDCNVRVLLCSHPSHMHRSLHCPKIVTLLKLEIRTDNERGTRTENLIKYLFYQVEFKYYKFVGGQFFQEHLESMFFSLSLPSAKVRRIGVQGTICESETDWSARDKLGLLLWAKVCRAFVKTKRV